MGCPIRKSTDHCSYAAPRSLSQLYTSFFASVCLGIHRVPLVCLYYMTCTASPPYGLHKYFMLLVYNCGLDVGRTASRYLGVAHPSNRTDALLSSAACQKQTTSDLLLLLLLSSCQRTHTCARGTCRAPKHPTFFIGKTPGICILSSITSYISISQKTSVELRGFEPRPCLAKAVL